ncbi:hypothetical protein [Streptomyces sp. NPDC055134]
MGLIAGVRRVVIDGWSWLNHKSVFADDLRGMSDRRAFREAAFAWVSAADARCLAAYKLLAACDNNQVAGLAVILDGRAPERRELGDPAMFVDIVMAHVLGREQHIAVQPPWPASTSAAARCAPQSPPPRRGSSSRRRDRSAALLARAQRL